MMAWLDRPSLPNEPGAPPRRFIHGTPPADDIDLAIRVWNLAGGLDFAGLEVAAEIYGVTDLEVLIAQLAVIHDKQQAERAHG